MEFPQREEVAGRRSSYICGVHMHASKPSVTRAAILVLTRLQLGMYVRT